MSSQGQQCARGLCAGGALQASLCRQQVILGLWARMLCVLRLGHAELLGELPCCMSEYFLALGALEEQNSLEMSASHPSQLALLRDQILT